MKGSANVGKASVSKDVSTSQLSELTIVWFNPLDEQRGCRTSVSARVYIHVFALSSIYDARLTINVDHPTYHMTYLLLLNLR